MYLVHWLGRGKITQIINYVEGGIYFLVILVARELTKTVHLFQRGG